MTRIDWGGTDRRMKQRIGDYGQAVRQGAFNLGQHWAAALEAFAKANRPWTDRTSNAVQSLWGRAFLINNGNTVVIVLSHGVFYGKYLETISAGKFAIISPTLETHYTDIWNSYKQMLGGR